MFLKPLYTLLCVVAIATACKPDNESVVGEYAYLGGEIINPNSEYIILHKSETIIDTLFLDNKNRFSYKIEDFTPGLYNIFDGKEAQALLIHNRDSLMLRINTFEFDESLVFTGIGAKENNYLIDLFLINEREQQTVIQSCNLNPIAFDEKYTAIKKAKLKKLKTFQSKNKTSKLFNQIAESNIHYIYYSQKELYPLINRKLSKKEVFKGLPEHFYNYRTNIDYNNDSLHDHSIYYTFLRLHFDNITLQEGLKNYKTTHYNDLLPDYNLDKMRLIDERVSNVSIKNKLLGNAVRHFLSVSNKTEDYDDILQSFMAKSTNKNDINQAILIVNSYKKLKPGLQIPEALLYNTKNDTITLKSLIKKPTVVSFWTRNNKYSVTASNKRIKALKKVYPEANFIAINIDKIASKEQIAYLKQHDLSTHNQYRFVVPEQAIKTLSIRPINKVFILDSEGHIVNAKADIFNINFEKELLSVINN